MSKPDLIQSLPANLRSALEKLDIEDDKQSCDLSQSSIQHLDHHLHLMDLEKEEEKKKPKAMLSNLIISETDFDTEYGDYVLVLKSMHKTGFGRSSFKRRDKVCFLRYRESLEEDDVNVGSILYITAKIVKIAFPDESIKDQAKAIFGPFTIKLYPDEVSIERIIRGLEIIKEGAHKPISNSAIEVIFHDRMPSEPNDYKITEFFNKGLDDSQKDAINFAMNAKELAIIHGPPGTGKTTVLVEFILQALKKDQKVLICTASNLAVDVILNKLSKSPGAKGKFVRIGNPFRVPIHLKEFTLRDIISKDSTVSALLKKLRAINTVLRGRQCYGDHKKSLLFEKEGLEKMVYLHRQRVIRKVTLETQIILSTLTSAHSKGDLKYILENQHFDLLIVDECSQSVQGATFIAVPHAKKVILAGDHLQLPPVVMSQTAQEDGLQISLMEWVLEKFKSTPEKIMRMLNIQYRMNEKIMKWSSDSFYDSKIVTHSSVKNLWLKDKYPKLDRDDFPPLLMIDTKNAGPTDMMQDGMGGKNLSEVNIVAKYVEKLLFEDIDPKDIGIITPYNLQVNALKEKMALTVEPEIEISTVDGFQGHEREIIILSMVRSNLTKFIGFLKDFRRNNVAVTRAKSHLVMICNSATLSSDPDLKRLIELIRKYGEVRFDPLTDESE